MLTMLQMILQNYLYRLKMSNPYEQFRQAIMGGLPIDNAVSFDQFQDARLSGLLKSLESNPQIMSDMSNVSQQINQQQVDKNLKEQKRKESRQALEDIAARFGIIIAQQSGNYQQANIMQNNLLERQKARVAEQERINQLQKFNSMVKGTEFEDIANVIGGENAQKLYSQVLVNKLTAKPDKLPTSIQEYEFAKSQGFQGSLIDFINSKNPGDTFNLGNTEDVEIIKSRIELGKKDIEATKKSLETTKELLPRLNAAQRILKADDFQTGPLEAATLDIRKLYSDIFGVEVPGLDNQQAFDAFTKFTIPRMRPPGSGATSDFEANLFEQSTASLGKTKKANQIIIGTMLQTARREQELSMLKEEYFGKYNTTIGFDKYIKDNNLMPRLYIDITSSDQAIDLFNKGLLRDGDVYIDFITDPNNPQLAVFDKRDIR